MQITAVTAPTRGPDYVAPVASSGTPIVTATQPASPVATEPSFTAASLTGDTTEGARKQRALPINARAAPPPSRYLTTTRGAILTALQDIPASHVPFHLATQAYLAQRRAESDAAAATVHATPETASSITATVDEHLTAPTTPSDLSSPAPPQHSESATARGLDVIA